MAVIHRTSEHEVVFACVENDPVVLPAVDLGEELPPGCQRAVAILAFASELLKGQLREHWAPAEAAASALERESVYVSLVGDGVSLDGHLVGTFKMKFGKQGATDRVGLLWQVARTVRSPDVFRQIYAKWHAPHDTPHTVGYVRFEWLEADARRLNVPPATSTAAAVVPAE